MNHKWDKNDKAKAEKDNDNPQQFEETEEVDLVESLDEAEMCIVANLVENSLAAKKVELLVKQSIDKLYDTVINNEGNKKEDCHECNIKEEKISGQEKMLDDNEMKIDEKSAAIRALQSNARTAAVAKAAADKRVIEAENVRKLLAEKTNKLEGLKVELLTKDAIIAL